MQALTARSKACELLKLPT